MVATAVWPRLTFRFDFDRLPDFDRFDFPSFALVGVAPALPALSAPSTAPREARRFRVAARAFSISCSSASARLPPA